MGHLEPTLNIILLAFVNSIYNKEKKKADWSLYRPKYKQINT